MTQNHRVGVNECCLVIRHLKLKRLEHDTAEVIGQKLEGIIGVDMVSFNEDSSVLNVAYDAGKVNIDDIEAIVREGGADIDDGWWTHLKEGWYRYTDENVRENFKREPWSCHQAPPKRK